MATDAAAQTLERFKDPSQWKVRKRVPMFLAHRETVKDKNGKVKVYDFPKAKLESMAAALNRRETVDGNPVPLTIGHIKPGMAEKDIGPTVGFSRTHTVEKVGPKQRWGIVCDEWRLPEKDAEAKEYPHRSVEIDPKTLEIDRVCLIKRTPKLPLGAVLEPREVLQFQADGCSMLAYSAENDDRLIYSLQDEEDPMNDELKAMFKEIMGSLAALAGKPKLAYSAADPDGDDDEALIYSKEQLDKAVADERTKANAAIKRLEARVALVEKDREGEKLIYERRADLQELADEGYQLEIDDELSYAEGMSAEAWEKNKGRIKKCYQRDPGARSLIRLEETPRRTKEVSPDAANKAGALMAKNPSLSWEDALKQVG